MITLNERYVVDQAGNKVQVILDVEVFQRLLEELEMVEDVRLYDEARAAPTEVLPLEQAMAEIRDRHR